MTRHGVTDDAGDAAGAGAEARGPSSVLIAAIIAVLFAAYFAYGTLSAGDEAPGAAVEREPFAVLVQPAALTDRPALVTLRGRTEAGRSVTVRAETGARVEAVLTQEGARVARGAPLCRLEDAGRSAGLAEAEAQLVRARTEADAAERLAAEGFASTAQRDAARAALRAAEARRDAAAKTASAALIAAPIEGTVTALPAEPGDVLAPGAPCAVVSDLSRTIVAGELSPEEAARLAPGAAARVVVDGEAVPGTLRFLSPAASSVTGAYAVEIDLAEGGLRDGLTATAEIEAGRAGATLLPRAALVLNDEGRLGVRVIAETLPGTADSKDGRVAFRPVALVGEASGGVFVEGVREGDRVIVRGQDYVTEGARVAFVEADAAGAIR